MPTIIILLVFCCLTVVLPTNLLAQETAENAPADNSGLVVTDTVPAANTQIPEAVVQLPRDIVLVLDNSGDMKRDDPQFQVKQAVVGFVDELDENSRIGIIIYDQQIRLALTMTSANPANRERILAGMDQLDYNGLFTDSPAAIERAVYELMHNGQPMAGKHIVFLTNGAVETDNQTTESERSEWLQNDIVDEAAASGIKISGIAFTENADLDLIQRLADRTGGSAHQVITAGELPQVFTSIDSNTRELASSPLPADMIEVAPPTIAAQTPGESEIGAIPAVPVQGMGQQERVRSLIILVAAGILVITLGTLVVLLIKRGRDYRRGLEINASEGYLNDVNGYTALPVYKLGKRPTMLGRVAGKDTGHLDYVVIPESTIGRRHAVIEYKDYGYWVVDQGSINGTFVNDVRVNGDTRLKHGDRIRLHKFEFEFVMPDLEDAGVTKLSPMATASVDADVEPDVDAVKADMAAEEYKLDFDFSGGTGAELQTDADSTDSGEATLLPGYELNPRQAGGASEDATLMPDFDKHAQKEASPMVADRHTEEEHQDETLMPGTFDEMDEDETIRPDQETRSGKSAGRGDKGN